MVRVAIIADTHVPARADGLPGWVRDEIEAADHVIHAGDFDSHETYDEIASLADDLTAVTGNMDPALGLEAVETVELGGVPFVVTHGTGPPRGYHERVRDTVVDNASEAGADRPAEAVGVSGHTHEVVDEVVEGAGDDGDGVRVLNPGSATGAAPATEATLYRATASSGDLTVTVVTEGQ